MAYAHNNLYGYPQKAIQHIIETQNLNSSEILEFTYEHEMLDFFANEGRNTTQTGISFLNVTRDIDMIWSYILFYNHTGKRAVMNVQTILDNALGIYFFLKIKY